jgi:hypothetical protein
LVIFLYNLKYIFSMIMKESSVKRKSHLDILENVSCMVTSMRLFEICRGRTWILYNQEVTQLREISIFYCRNWWRSDVLYSNFTKLTLQYLEIWIVWSNGWDSQLCEHKSPNLDRIWITKLVVNCNQHFFYIWRFFCPYIYGCMQNVMCQFCWNGTLLMISWVYENSYQI